MGYNLVFKTIFVLLDPDWEIGALEKHIDNICDWLERWNSWFLKHYGILEKERLHFLYDRNVAVLGGDRVFAISHRIRKLADFVHDLGLGFSLEVSISECLEYKDALNYILSSGKIKTLIVKSSKVEENKYETAFALLESCINYGTFLVFTGPVEFWKKIGVLDSDIFNGHYLRIFPGHEERSGIARSPGSLEPSKLFSPCKLRFVIIVAQDGYLYPCIGMLGLPNWSLGSIHQDPAETALAKGDLHSELEKLSHKGPLISDGNLINEFPKLNPVCATHRLRELKKMLAFRKK